MASLTLNVQYLSDEMQENTTDRRKTIFVINRHIVILC